MQVNHTYSPRQCFSQLSERTKVSSLRFFIYFTLVIDCNKTFSMKMIENHISKTIKFILEPHCPLKLFVIPGKEKGIKLHLNSAS